MIDVAHIRFDTSEETLKAAAKAAEVKTGDRHDPGIDVYNFTITLRADHAERIGIASAISVMLWDRAAYSVSAVMSEANASDGKQREVIAQRYRFDDETAQWINRDVVSWAIAQLAGQLDYLRDLIAGHDRHPGTRLAGWHPSDERRVA